MTGPKHPFDFEQSEPTLEEIERSFRRREWITVGISAVLLTALFLLIYFIPFLYGVTP